MKVSRESQRFRSDLRIRDVGRSPLLPPGPSDRSLLAWARVFDLLWGAFALARRCNIGLAIGLVLHCAGLLIVSVWAVIRGIECSLELFGLVFFRFAGIVRKYTGCRGRVA